MKANVPEKIYLQENTTTDCYSEFWPEWFEARAKDSDIEYTRTDAFIEKAARWIENNLPKYSELTDKDEYGNKLKEPVMNVFYGKAVKDFINYMKGE